MSRDSVASGTSDLSHGPFNATDDPVFEITNIPSVSSCLHEGVPHIAWVEELTSFDGLFHAGPFVARDTGSAWETLGMGALPGAVSPFEPISSAAEVAGDQGPFRRGSCRLASDGTNLYLAYAVLYETLEPETPSLVIPTLGYGYAFFVMVWQWDGAAWTLLGSNTTDIVLGVPPSMDLSADPAALGACYLTYDEIGRAGVHNTDPVVRNFWAIGFGSDPFGPLLPDFSP